MWGHPQFASAVDGSSSSCSNMQVEILLLCPCFHYSFCLQHPPCQHLNDGLLCHTSSIVGNFNIRNYFFLRTSYFSGPGIMLPFYKIVSQS